MWPAKIAATKQQFSLEQLPLFLAAFVELPLPALPAERPS